MNGEGLGQKRVLGTPCPRRESQRHLRSGAEGCEDRQELGGCTIEVRPSCQLRRKVEGGVWDKGCWGKLEN